MIYLWLYATAAICITVGYVGGALMTRQTNYDSGWNDRGLHEWEKMKERREKNGQFKSMKRVP